MASLDAHEESPFGPDGTPATVAGGFQQFCLADARDHKDDDDGAVEDHHVAAAASAPLDPQQQQQTKKQAFLSRHHCLDQYPRTYNVILKIILPLFVLIGISFLCGYLLSLWESDAEKKNNNAALAGVVDTANRVELLAQLASSTPALCLEEYLRKNPEENEGETLNRTTLTEHMKECGTDISSKLKQLLEEFQAELREQAYNSLTFDWTSCREGLAKYADRDEQAYQIVDNWIENYLFLVEKYAGQKDAVDRATAEATGTDTCEINVSAGALFWFTIMTTIGYGNTTATTSAGRALVYTLGFICILVFTALIGQAGYICLVVVDDMFLRCGQKRLTQGWLAALFWLVSCVLWLLVIAAIALTGETAASVDADLSSTFWLAFMSVTTVGLGDYHLSHDQVEPGTVFTVALLFLIGFVLLANFLFKLSNALISEGVSQSRKLEVILEQSRQKCTQDDSDIDSSQGENEDRPVEESPTDIGDDKNSAGPNGEQSSSAKHEK